MPNKNFQRIQEDVKREISAAVQELKDNRLNGIVTITRCELTSDLSYCKVYFSFIAAGTAPKNIAGKNARECLTKASGFIKKQINARVKMRKMPELIFICDDSADNYMRIDEILKTTKTTAQTLE
jgi:ribosome-binding factor A